MLENRFSNEFFIKSWIIYGHFIFEIITWIIKKPWLCTTAKEQKKWLPRWYCFDTNEFWICPSICIQQNIERNLDMEWNGFRYTLILLCFIQITTRKKPNFERESKKIQFLILFARYNSILHDSLECRINSKHENICIQTLETHELQSMMFLLLNGSGTVERTGEAPDENDGKKINNSKRMSCTFGRLTFLQILNFEPIRV